MTNMAASVPLSTHKKFNLRKTTGNVLLYVFIAIVGVITLFPIDWMIVCTLQPNKSTLHYPPPLFPKELVTDQFYLLFANLPIGLWLTNSFLIALMTSLISTALAVLGAYALSGLRWPGRNTF